MPKRKNLLTTLLISFPAVIVLLLTFHWAAGLRDVVAQAEAVLSLNPQGRQEAGPGVQASGFYTVYLPITMRLLDPAWQPIWGIQTTDYNVLDKAEEAGMAWIRIDAYWKNIEPTNDNYNWSSLDNAISNSIAAGLTPMVDIVTNPTWADADDTHCGPLKDNQYLTDFLTDLVNRYKGAPYNVKYWEIGNEVDHKYDISHQLYPGGGIGCWGDKVAEYVTFLRTAHDAIRAADSNATILLGALTMIGDSDDMNGDFLADVLAAGGGPYFDVVSFHFYNGQEYADYSCADPPGCTITGIVGKATIIRNWLASYPAYANKPLMLTESAYRCGSDGICDSAELQSQANYVPIYHLHSMAADVEAVIWFTLNYPGFYGSSLLDSGGNAKPAYNAYKAMTQELNMYSYHRRMTTAETGGFSDVEGHYLSIGNSAHCWVLWCTGSGSRAIGFSTSLSPSGKFRVVDVYGQNEQILADGDDGVVDGKVTIQIGQSPKYVKNAP
ncbi:MAG: glycoside hydrolase family 5 protein [Anaerolineae bacterium]|jgi:hypothetical protein|nr:glycoside hydrolase family 5 protein [Anaerolineae bacterium]